MHKCGLELNAVIFKKNDFKFTPIVWLLVFTILFMRNEKIQKVFDELFDVDIKIEVSLKKNK